MSSTNPISNFPLSGLERFESSQEEIKKLAVVLKEILTSSSGYSEEDLVKVLINESKQDLGIIQAVLSILEQDSDLEKDRECLKRIDKKICCSESIVVDSIIPSNIFGERPRRIEKVNIEGRAQQVVQTFKDVLQNLKKNQIEWSENAIRDYIKDAANGDLNVIHYALKILQDDAALKDEKPIFVNFDKVVLSDIQRPFMQSIEARSPREISLNESELPEVPSNVREWIEGYKSQKIPLETVKENLKLNPQNTREILNYIKIIDLETDRLSLQEKRERGIDRNQSTYPLRTYCLQASEGKMTTFEAYTKSINIKLYTNPFAPASREYASHEYNYIPERVKDHVRILAEYATDMMALSKRLTTSKRTFFCVGGNTAVGKSRCVKEDKAFASGLVNGELLGALNPDTVKYKLRKDVSGVTNQQVHVEGVAVGQKLSLELQNRALKASIVIDERLGVPSVIQSLLDKAQQTKAVVRLKDIEGPLMLSCLRVLGRNVKTEPCVPFDPIAVGYKTLRENRNMVIELIRKSDTVEAYELFAVNEQNQTCLVASKTKGVFTIFDQSMYDRATSKTEDGEIIKVKSILITPEFIEFAANLPGVNVGALQKYTGKTIATALEEHSQTLP